MLPPCGLAPSPMPCDDFLPTNLTGNSLPTGRGPARNAAAETEKSLQRFNLIYFLGLFIGRESEEGSKCSEMRFRLGNFFRCEKAPSTPENLGGKLWSPLSARPSNRPEVFYVKSCSYLFFEENWQHIYLSVARGWK